MNTMDIDIYNCYESSITGLFKYMNLVGINEEKKWIPDIMKGLVASYLGSAGEGDELS